MGTIVPTQQPLDGAQLTKPTDWAHFMVTAALKFAFAEKTPVTYSSPDEARLDILNTLNWFEAHSEYEWPNFTRLGFDFSQAMRFRRALINDVFIALQKSGNVKIGNGPGVLGTPESGVVGSSKRTGGASRCMAEHKRRCKREDDLDTDAASQDSSKDMWNDLYFLSEVLRELMGRCDTNFRDDYAGEKCIDTIANLVHDGVVSVWDGPRANYDTVPEELKRKLNHWDEKRTAARDRSPELGERTGMTSVPTSR